MALGVESCSRAARPGAAAAAPAHRTPHPHPPRPLQKEARHPAPMTNERLGLGLAPAPASVGATPLNRGRSVGTERRKTRFSAIHATFHLARPHRRLSSGNCKSTVRRSGSLSKMIHAPAGFSLCYSFFFFFSFFPLFSFFKKFFRFGFRRPSACLKERLGKLQTGSGVSSGRHT